MRLNRKSSFIIKRYGSKAPHLGPTVYLWPKGIYKGKDLPSGRRGRGLSAAMGRFPVSKKGKKA